MLLSVVKFRVIDYEHRFAMVSSYIGEHDQVPSSAGDGASCLFAAQGVIAPIARASRAGNFNPGKSSLKVSGDDDVGPDAFVSSPMPTIWQSSKGGPACHARAGSAPPSLAAGRRL